MIGIRSAFSIRARGHRPHLEAVYMTAPRSVCRNTKKALPTGGRPYMTGVERRSIAVRGCAIPMDLHPSPQPSPTRGEGANHRCRQINFPPTALRLRNGQADIVNLYGEHLLTFARTEVISTRPGTSGLLAFGLESTMTGSTRSSGGLDDRRKRLMFRCWHRGTREMDLILGRFADSEIANLSEDELMQFELLMDVPDPDLYAALTGDMPPAPEYANRLFDRIKSFRADHDA